MEAPPLTIENIRRELTTTQLGRQLRLHGELSSTNEEAVNLAQAGAEHGTVVVAESQTAGRGRHGRRWFSPPGYNLYCSVLARTVLSPGPVAPAERLSWIPLVAAVAVTEAVHATAGVPLSLKWPNDLLLDDRKVGGILCESGSIGSTAAFVVIGLGLNVNGPRNLFPPELQSVAASLRERTDGPIDRSRLLARWLLELEQLLDSLITHSPRQLRDAYVARCSTIGRQVKARLGEGRDVIGTAVGIGEDGSLHVLPGRNSTARQIIEIRAADVIHLRE